MRSYIAQPLVQTGRLAPAARKGLARIPLVLIVEDDPETLVDLRLRLLASGYRTRYATNAFSAVRRIKNERPDLVLLDLDLPSNGARLVLDAIKRLPLALRIPVVTMHGKGKVPKPPISTRGILKTSSTLIATEDPIVTTHLARLRHSESLLSAVKAALPD